MGQSRKLSLLESIANVAIGYGIAILAQELVFPMFGIYMSFDQHAKMGAIFTIISLIRSYALRRLFNLMQKDK